MKTLSISKFLIFGLFIFSLLTACEEADSEKSFGKALIYMPQSVMLSGGSNNNYPVPGGSTTNPNYIIEGNNANIVLGVYRSGLQELKSFSVGIVSDADTITQIINNNTIVNSVVLPQDVYTFPSSVTVENGSRQSTFYLTLNQAKLKSDYASLAGKKLLVAIKLTSPSRYELNKLLATTIVVINADDFLD